MSWNQTPNRPPDTSRADSYTNMLNKFGTVQDNSTAYEFHTEGIIPDMELTEHYESNGLFSKIIDTPAEEAIKHGFRLGLKSPEVDGFIVKTLDRLSWEEKASTAIKWSRLYGGSIIVMLADDGGGIDEPLNWKRLKSIEELRVYERAVVYPDYSSLYNYDPRDPTRSTTPQFGMPEYYFVQSVYGQFWVHESRCLVFRNGIIPERTLQPYYRFWGVPEFLRIKRELREAVTSHSTGVKMLERSVQAIYAMKDLATLLATDDGENIVIKRLQVIDMARGLLNSIAIDSEGESYDFKTIPFSGVKDIIDTTCNMLSAVTNIPQTVLFGRSPAGENSTGASDLENYYNYVERIQRLMLRGNLNTLINVIVRVGLRTGKLEEEPDIELAFNPLWSMSEAEQAQTNNMNANTQLLKAQTAQIYVDMSALDPSEVRKGLAKDEEFAVEELIGEDDIESTDMWGGQSQQAEPPAQPIAEAGSVGVVGSKQAADAKGLGSVGVLVLNDTGESVLCGERSDNKLTCGPGGHIEPGETPMRAAMRETKEEFGITPKSLTLLGKLKGLDAQYGEPHIFLCTDYEGEPKASDEIRKPCFFPMDEFEPEDIALFPPFAESLKLLPSTAQPTAKISSPNSENPLTAENPLGRMIDEESTTDGGPGSGRYPKGSGAANQHSATGANPSLPGMTKETLNAHWGGRRDHSGQYPGLNKNQYSERALALVRSPVGGSVDGYRAANGAIVRYDRNTNDFVKGYNTGVATMFKPDDAGDYFSRQMKRDGGVQDD